MALFSMPLLPAVFALTLVCLCFHLDMVTGVPVSLELGIEPSRGGSCPGEDVGLTSIAVFVQYRTIVTTPNATLVQEWIVLAEVNLRDIFDQDLQFNLDDSVHDGVQFRLLQLEHGGEDCNCWNLNKIAVNLDGNRIELRVGSMVCFETGECGGSASVERGRSTAVVYLPGRSGEKCPENSEVDLIPARESPLIQNCAQITPRL